MQTARLLRAAAAVAAAVVAGSTMAAAPAFAAKPIKMPVVITAHPASPTSATTATFTWSGGAPGAVLQCSLDGASYATCAGGTISYSGLSDGSHSFTVRSKPPRPVTDRFTWVVDTRAPTAPVITQLASPTRTTAANVYFTDTDPSAVSHTCALDLASATACSSPYVVSGLSDGPHTVHVTAADALGNTSAPAGMTWTVDGTAPISVVVTVPSLTKDPFVDVTFTADGATSYTCSVDNGPVSACMSPYHVAGLAEGQHSISVLASDGVGNTSLPGTGVWTVDMTAPATPTFMTGPADPTDQADVDFVLGTVDSSGTLMCALDTAVFTPCPSPLGYTGIGLGDHQLDVKAVDAAGNASATSTWSWTRGSTAVSPVHITDGPLSPSNATTPDFIFLPTGTASAGFWCSLDGGPEVDCDSGPWPFASPLSGDGAHVFSVKAEDANTGDKSSPALWTWTADFTPPTAPVFSTAPSASTTETSAVFSFAQEGGTSYTCSLDGAAAVPCASPVTYHGLALGSHTFRVVAADAAGNSSSTDHAWQVVAPTTPSTPTTPTQPGSTSAATATATVSAGRALRGVSTIAYDRDVKGISAATVALRVVGGSPVPVTISCVTAGGATADCAAGPVRTVRVQPTVALVPGQSYTLSTAAGVTDAASKAATPVTQSFRASTDEQESSLRGATTWRRSKAAAAYGKRYLSEGRAGATVSYAFRGTKVTWFTMTSRSQGRATVYVDGVRKAKVNNYSAATVWRVARTVKGLRSGAHTLKIVVAGRTGSARGTGTAVTVDAVRANGSVVKNPRLVATWAAARATGASGGAYAVSGTAKAASSFTFKGTSLTWVTSTAPTMGKAKVYVDGVLKAKVDNFTKKSRWNVRRTFQGLADRQHTVKIVVTGKKRARATGTDVVVDRWIVG